MNSCSRDGFLRVLDLNSMSTTNESSTIREIYCGVQHFCGASSDVSQRGIFINSLNFITKFVTLIQFYLDPFTFISPSSEENRVILLFLLSFIR